MITKPSTFIIIYPFLLSRTLGRKGKSRSKYMQDIFSKFREQEVMQPLNMSSDVINYLKNTLSKLAIFFAAPWWRKGYAKRLRVKK